MLSHVCTKATCSPALTRSGMNERSAFATPRARDDRHGAHVIGGAMAADALPVLRERLPEHAKTYAALLAEVGGHAICLREAAAAGWLTWRTSLTASAPLPLAKQARVSGHTVGHVTRCGSKTHTIAIACSCQLCRSRAGTAPLASGSTAPLASGSSCWSVARRKMASRMYLCRGLLQLHCAIALLLVLQHWHT